MLAKLIAMGIALLFSVAVSASDVQEMVPPPEAVSGLRGFPGDAFEDISEIIGGHRVPNARIPYYTYLVMFEGSKVASWCGGTLIHDDIVLMAAHCMHNKSGKPWSRVTAIGALKENFNPKDPFNPQTGQWRDVVIEHIAPNYDPTLLRNDVALLKLASPIGGIVKPKLNNNAAIPYKGQIMYATGYGYTSTHGKPATELMAAGMYNQPPYVCRSHLGRSYQESTMICGYEGSQGSCFGDSGGPLLVIKNGKVADDLLIGIVSFGVGGCVDTTPNLADAYARVSGFYGLIKDFVCTKSAYSHTSPLCG